jgi:leucyl-tRNA synthetase
MRRWLDRVYRLFMENHISLTNDVNKINPTLDRAYHKFVKHVTNEFENRTFNVAVSQMMVYINECYNHKVFLTSHLQNFLVILSCFAPHLSEEL